MFLSDFVCPFFRAVHVSVLFVVFMLISWDKIREYSARISYGQQSIQIKAQPIEMSCDISGDCGNNSQYLERLCITHYRNVYPKGR